MTKFTDIDQPSCEQEIKPVRKSYNEFHLN